MTERARLLLARLYEQSDAPTQEQWDAWRAEIGPLAVKPPDVWPWHSPFSAPVAREEAPLAHLEINPNDTAWGSPR